MIACEMGLDDSVGSWPRRVDGTSILGRAGAKAGSQPDEASPLTRGQAVGQSLMLGCSRRDKRACLGSTGGALAYWGCALKDITWM